MKFARIWICAIAVAAVALPTGSSAQAHAAAARPTLAVVLLGGGRVTSRPAGISCPGRCAATFAPGTSVVLAPAAKKGSTFLRWGGSCAGKGACRVRLSALAAVAAQFTPGRGAPPTSHKSVAEPGAYSLYNSYRTFFVAPGGRSILNIAIAGVAIACTPAASGAASSDTIVIARATIRPDGSFVAKGSQTGLFAGVPAAFAYSFAGRFTAATATQPAGATGSYREDVVFKDNTTHRCTSNSQSWTAAKTGPIPQPASLVRPGKYSLYNSYKTFSVAPGGRRMVNIAIGGVSIACNPVARSAPTTDQIVIPQAAIRADGSFAATASQAGVFAGAPARFTYTFTGSFQGPDRQGSAAAAGLLREDIVFSDSAGTHTCTSNTQPWIATD